MVTGTETTYEPGRDNRRGPGDRGASDSRTAVGKGSRARSGPDRVRDDELVRTAYSGDTVIPDDLILSVRCIVPAEGQICCLHERRRHFASVAWRVPFDQTAATDVSAAGSANGSRAPLGGRRRGRPAGDLFFFEQR